MTQAASRWIAPAVSALALAVSACGGGGGSGGGTGPAPAPAPTPDPTPAPGPAPAPAPPPAPAPAPTPSAVFIEPATTSHFLSQATFGPTQAEIDGLTGTDAEAWLQAEFDKPVSRSLPYVQAFLARDGSIQDNGDVFYIAKNAPTWAFWTNAISGEDQLRQRVAYALSQILVISHLEGGNLFEQPLGVAYHQDILAEHAFGNYRDLLEAVTYSPAMADYLTYFRNLKEDPDSGRMPDENYAREIMQLFTIGLVELNLDGAPRTDASGAAIETYDNDDVTGLAKVFTGLSFDTDEFWYDWENLDPAVYYSPLKAFPEFHSDSAKTFLGTSIAAGTPAEESIDLALDTLFEHPNVAPFVSRQLIQRLVTSDPEPAYVERVAMAFEAGEYALPSGAAVGEGRRGDLSATVAAILFDEAARRAASRQADDFGKLREPAVRVIHWARAFDASNVTPEHSFALFNTGNGEGFGQAPYKSPSVFNFYRPGYVAPGTESGAAGMTVPELQIVNAGTVANYTNIMSYFVFGLAEDWFDEGSPEASTLIPDYADEIALADDPEALVEHLDTILTYGAMTTQTKADIAAFLADVPLEDEFNEDYDGREARAELAVLMVMTSPDYLVQR